MSYRHLYFLPIIRIVHRALRSDPCRVPSRRSVSFLGDDWSLRCHSSPPPRWSPCVSGKDLNNKGVIRGPRTPRSLKSCFLSFIVCYTPFISAPSQLTTRLHPYSRYRSLVLLLIPVSTDFPRPTERGPYSYTRPFTTDRKPSVRVSRLPKSSWVFIYPGYFFVVFR